MHPATRSGFFILEALVTCLLLTIVGICHKARTQPPAEHPVQYESR